MTLVVQMTCQTSDQHTEPATPEQELHMSTVNAPSKANNATGL
jgi:hypothetical protein